MAKVCAVLLAVFLLVGLLSAMGRAFGFQDLLETLNEPLTLTLDRVLRTSDENLVFVNRCHSDTPITLAKTGSQQTQSGLIKRCIEQVASVSREVCNSTNYVHGDLCAQTCGQVSFCQFHYADEQDWRALVMHWPRAMGICEHAQRDLRSVCRETFDDGSEVPYSARPIGVFNSTEECAAFRRREAPPFRMGDGLLSFQRAPCNELEPRTPGLVYARNVVVSGPGMGGEFESFVPSSIFFYEQYKQELMKNKFKTMALAKSCATNPTNCTLPMYPRVISYVRPWGDHSTHFLCDHLPGIIPLLLDLTTSGDQEWKIHLLNGPLVTNILTKFFGIDVGRIIDANEKGTFFAREAVTIQYGGIQSDGHHFSNFQLLRHMRLVVLKRARELLPDAFTEPPFVLIVVRTGTGHGRADSNQQIPLYAMLKSAGVPVRRFDDDNATLMQCFECQVALFHGASHVVGYQGAGMTHSLYMRPNTTVATVGMIAVVLTDLAMIASAKFIGLGRGAMPVEIEEKLTLNLSAAQNISEPTTESFVLQVAKEYVDGKWQRWPSEHHDVM